MSLDDPVVTLRYLEGQRAVAQFSGELDMDTIAGLYETLTSLADSGCRHVVLDMSRVKFCDSSALSEILGARQHLTDHRCTMAMAAADEPLQRLLQLTSVDTVIPQYPTLDQALTHTPA